MSGTVLRLLDCDTNHLGDKLKCRTISSGLSRSSEGFWETGDWTEMPHHRKHPTWSWGAWRREAGDLQLKTYWAEGTEANLRVCWLPPISGQQITWHLSQRVERYRASGASQHPLPDFRTHSSDAPYVLGQYSEPIGFRINLMLNLGDLSDMFFGFGWLIFTTCECRGNI